jgi:hypothetical protein
MVPVGVLPEIDFAVDIPFGNIEAPPPRFGHGRVWICHPGQHLLNRVRRVAETPVVSRHVSYIVVLLAHGVIAASKRVCDVLYLSLK